jgi:hypothetical protein
MQIETNLQKLSTIMAHPVLLIAPLVFFAVVQCIELSKYAVSSVTYNPDGSYSGRINRFLNGDHSPPRSAFSLEKHYPLYAYKPNCSIEVIMQTWTNENSQLPAFGQMEVALPTVTQSKSWKCYYRSSWLNDDENIPPATKILPVERYLTTLVYCPSLYGDGDDGHVDALKNQAGSSTFGMCPLLDKAITKEGGSSIRLQIQLLNVPKLLLHDSKTDTALEIGPVALKAVTKRSRATVEMSTRFTTSNMEKPVVQVIPHPASSSNKEAGAVVEDNCAAEWDSVTIVGRCFGLKTHTEYPEFKHVPLVSDAQQCRALCCQLGNKCISWQYWTDIKLCKLGGAVRIGHEHAKTDLWCDSEPPIVWSGEKVKRLPSGVWSAIFVVHMCFARNNCSAVHCTSLGTFGGSWPNNSNM